eukprot:6191340-Pleurochrysis_carterae.AAC.2
MLAHALAKFVQPLGRGSFSLVVMAQKTSRALIFPLPPSPFCPVFSRHHPPAPARKTSSLTRPRPESVLRPLTCDELRVSSGVDEDCPGYHSSVCPQRPFHIGGLGQGIVHLNVDYTAKGNEGARTRAHAHACARMHAHSCARTRTRKRSAYICAPYKHTFMHAR